MSLGGLLSLADLLKASCILSCQCLPRRLNTTEPPSLETINDSDTVVWDLRGGWMFRPCQ